MFASLDETRADLGSLFPRFHACVDRALQRYVTDYAPLRHTHTRRTTASVIHDLMVDEFAAEFVDSRDVKLFPKNNTTIVVAHGGKYKIKLKKLDTRLRSSNIPTQEVIRFMTQEQIWIEGVPLPTNLNLGYQVSKNAALTESRTYLTCPNGTGKLAWNCEISHAEIAAEEEAKPLAEVIPFAPSERGRAKLRKPKDDEKSGSERPNESGSNEE